MTHPNDIAAGSAARWRWPRLLVIATAAIVLASCRGVVQPQVAALTTAAVTSAVVAADAVAADADR